MKINSQKVSYFTHLQQLTTSSYKQVVSQHVFIMFLFLYRSPRSRDIPTTFISDAPKNFQQELMNEV